MSKKDTFFCLEKAKPGNPGRDRAATSRVRHNSVNIVGADNELIEMK